MRSTLVLLSLLSASTALAQSGVSDDRVSLPDGPGSIGGVGENVSVVGNMGALTQSVPFRIPAGFEGATPELGLRYSSSEGSGVAGIGWAFDVPSIERMTSKGLPDYDADDLFAADGGDQLVRVSRGATDSVYRARYERNFARYTWVGVADGKAGYFKAEYPDGTTSYYGADRDGNLVPEARVTKPGGGTFRYLLVESVDPFGHREHYGYVLAGNYPLLDTVDYVHDAQNKPRFSVRFVYEARSDVLSDGKPGFDLTLAQRLSSVRVFSGAELIRQYDLAYEPEATAGSFSRLASVTEKGRGGAIYPVKPTFAYSQTLGGACTSNCGKPFVVDMGTLQGGVDLRTGSATLLDINGDALPDVLDTTGGVHRFFLSKPSADGKPTFGASTLSKAATSAFQLTNPSVQVLDLNGDGFSDMISARTGTVLCNNGSGDWSGDACGGGAIDIELADDPADTGVQDPLRVRFFDYDNDKRIDLLRTSSAQATDVRRDTGTGFAPVSVAPIGEVFDESALQLAEINGDGLLDPVVISDAGTLRYRLNFGLGVWGDWKTVQLAGLGQAELRTASLQDLNGDGLDDLVVVAPGVVKVLLNRSNARFGEPILLNASNVDGALPEQTETTSVLFADMNGNGSDDVVWVSNSGRVQFLDLFPIKPNLLARVENGIGTVQSIAYGTSLAELARDASWSYRLSYAMNVVKKVDQWVTLTGTDSGGLHEVIEYAYHDGFYDGVEKQFRGFAGVEQSTLADALDSQQPGLTVARYDVGASDAYYNGLLVQNDVFSIANGARVPLRSTRSKYSDCPLGGVPANVTPAVRHVCETQRDEVMQEGAPQQEWAVKRTLLEYDAYGNVGREQSLGVIGMGAPESPGACRACIDADDVACGPSCAGDETFTEVSYVSPETGTGGKWFLRKPQLRKVYGAQGGPVRDSAYYYDGEPFTGLPAGQLTLGNLSRETSKVTDVSSLDSLRAQYDVHGNELVVLDGLGSPGDANGHRTRYEYDGLGLNLTATERANSDAQGPYALRREYAYESAFNEVSEATAWILVRGGAATSSRDSQRFRYDDFGRVAKLIEPGDSEEAPTTQYTYELANPVTRITVAQRSKVGGTPDSTKYLCHDGRGRLVQTIASVSEGRFQADGFVTYNSRGARVREYQPYELSAPTCATAAPEGVAFTAYQYDAIRRSLATTYPDATLYAGKASSSRTEYGVLVTRSFDEEDANESGPYVNTPTVRHYDGEGRLITIERALEQSSAITRLRYDALDNLRGYIDAAGNVRTQEFDLLGRAVRISDPNTGVTLREYDAASNLVREQSASGDVVRYAYDGLNRQKEIWSDSDRAGTLVSNTYDTLADCKPCSAGAGALVEARYPLGFDRFGYDVRRRTIYTARSLEGKLFETSLVFDNLDRLVSTTYPDGQTLGRSYDGLGRLTAIPGVVSEIRYDARGLRTLEVLANGTQSGQSWDERLRLRSQTLSAANDVVFDVTFNRDRVGNVSGIVAKPAGAHLARGAARSHDAWYRLTGSELDNEKLALGYDAIDNLSTRTSAGAGNLGTLSYAPAHPNATTGFGTTAFAYSADGDLEKRGNIDMSWDYQGRLTGAKSGATVLASFGYGAQEERVLKDEQGHLTYYVSPEFELRDGVGVVYPREGARRYARIESLSARQHTDLSGDGAIGIADAWLTQKGGKDAARELAASAKRVLFDAAVVTTFLHQDHLDNVIAASDASGKLVGERTFYDWGAERTSTSFVDDYGFSGQERDPSTGLLHYRFRYLDPQVGRWISGDPLFTVVDANNIDALGESTTGYAFIANGYGDTIDPLGLEKPKSKSAKKAAKERKERRGSVEAKQADGSGKVAKKDTPKERKEKQKEADKKEKERVTRVYEEPTSALGRLGKAIAPYSGKTRWHAEGTPAPKSSGGYERTGKIAVVGIGLAALTIGGGVAGYMLAPEAPADDAPAGGTTTAVFR